MMCDVIARCGRQIALSLFGCLSVLLASCSGDPESVTGDTAVSQTPRSANKVLTVEQLDATPHVDRPVAVTIYRDKYGTPHVFADDNYAVYFGYGYAVATDRLFQMEMLKRTAQGRVAEALGDDYLDLDIKIRTQYDHPLVREQVDALSPRDHDILAGYAAGMNTRIAELLADEQPVLPKPFYDYGFEPSYWSASDVAAIFVGSIAHRYADFNSERDNLVFLQSMQRRHGPDIAWAIFNQSKWLLDNTSPTTVPRSAPVNTATPERPDYLPQLPTSTGVAHLLFDDNGRFAGLSDDTAGRGLFAQFVASRGFDSHPEFMPASNFWAMTALSDANAALLNGPQFGFGTPSYVYGIGLHGGDFNVVGNTLLALPSLLFAHNNELAWGSTAGISDQTDEFWLQLNPDNPEQYRYLGEWRDFERWSENIARRDADPITVTARRAAQGMVQAVDVDRGVAWVRARAWEGKAVDDLMAWIWLSTDQSLAAAEARIAGKATNINMYTMDKTGNLGYVHSGKYPHRAPSHDPRLPAPGDGSQDWLGLRDYSDNPKMRDHQQGYVVNWNNRPAADWVSSDLWSYTWSRADRMHILLDELRSMKGGSVDDLVAINTRSTFEDVNYRYLLPPLLEAVEESPLTSAHREALDLLVDWDKSWVADSAGNYGPANAIMEAWVRNLHRHVFLDDVGEDSFHWFAATNYPNQTLGASLGTPVGVRVLTHLMDQIDAQESPAYDFFNGESPGQALLVSFVAAVDQLKSTQGDAIKTWRLTAAPMQWLPVNFRGVPQASENNTFSTMSYQNRGTENNVFVATGEGIVGRDVIPPGQGGHFNADGSPGAHFDDQFELYNTFGYKSLPFTEYEVKAAAATVVDIAISP